MLERYEVCCDIFHGFDRSAWSRGSSAAKVSVLPAAQELVLAQEGGKERLLQTVIQLSKAFALSVPLPETIRIRDDVAFCQAVRAAIIKTQDGDRKSWGDLDHAIRQIVSRKPLNTAPTFQSCRKLPRPPAPTFQTEKRAFTGWN